MLVRSHDNIGMDRGLEGVVLFLVVEGLRLVIWISKAVLMAVLDVLEREVWGSDVLKIIGARVRSDAGSTGENERGGVNVHRRRCVWGCGGMGMEGDEGRGRSWWTVRVNGREGVLNKWYIRTGAEEESVTTSNSYIIIVKDKGRKTRQESVSVACPLSKSRGVQQ